MTVLDVTVASRPVTDAFAPDSAGAPVPQLSVAELQQAYRTLQSDARTRQARRGRAKQAVATTQAHINMGALDGDFGTSQLPDLSANWVVVVAAHAGAGASTTALAVADATAGDGRAVHLIEACHPARSGLLAASSSELGPDEAGAWRRGRRGRRGRIVIDRRADDGPAPGWPSQTGDVHTTTVVDLGLLTLRSLAQIAVGGVGCLVVTRATVPGVRATEQTLDALAGARVAVAVLGGARWPGEVTSGLGPRLRGLREDGRVVRVPVPRGIAIIGPTSSPLPRDLLAAGRALLNLLDVPDRHDLPTAATRTARPEGTAR